MILAGTTQSLSRLHFEQKLLEQRAQLDGRSQFAIGIKRRDAKTLAIKRTFN
jgi:hypothetical protein